MQRRCVHATPIRLLAIVMLAACISAQSVAAAPAASIWHAAPNGADNVSCGSEALPCRSIQYVVNRAASGDSILVAGGTYVFNAAADPCIGYGIGTTGVVCVVNKSLSIYGGYTGTNWAVPDPERNLTVLDGQTAQRGVFVASTGPLTNFTLQGFTIRRGKAMGNPARTGFDKYYAYGGGLVSEFANIALKDLVCTDNQSIGENTGSGSGYVYGGAGSGGGVAVRWGSASLENIQFISNTAQGGQGSVRGGYSLGGGLYSFRTIMTGTYLYFDGNVSRAGNSAGDGADGGGERSDGLGGAGSFGGEGNRVLLSNVLAVNNLAQGGNAANRSGGAFGGAFKVELGMFTLRDALVRDNMARGGAAINGWLGNGGGVEAIEAEVHLDRVSIVHNRAIGGTGSSGTRGAAGGGGINSTAIGGSFTPVLMITNSVVADNSVEEGPGAIPAGGGAGGVWIQSTRAELNHVTIARNTVSEDMDGQAVLLIEIGSKGARAKITNSIIADHVNAWPAATNAAVHVKPLNTLTLTQNLLFGNTKDTNSNGSPAPAGAFTFLGTTYSGNPYFVAPGAPGYNYGIGPSSGAIDHALASALAVDRSGFLRPRGPASDLGAHEYSATAGRAFLALMLK